MKLIIGLLIGFSLGASYPLWAECCSGFNVPFDTQLEMDRREMERDLARHVPMPSYTTPSLSDPCRRY